MRRAALAALPLLVLPALPAHAAEVPDMVVATVATRYVPFQITVNQGDVLDLVNLENTPHDLVAHDWLDGAPLFRSAVVGVGGQARVVGVESLLPSAYPFVCSVHDSMTGLLIVQ
jgi:plastocyanin